MKKNQIQKLLNGVIKNFTETIKEENIKNYILNDSYITGGCIPSMIVDEWVNDYDIYFTSKDIADKVKKYFEDNKDTYNKNREKYKLNLITDNALNFSDKIQIITKWAGSPEEVTNNFDWQHIKSYYVCKDKSIVLCNDLYKLLVEKELQYTGSKYPLSSLFRLKKYLKKGWTISNVDILKIVFDTIKVLTAKENKQNIAKDTNKKRITVFEEEEIEEEEIIEEEIEYKVIAEEFDEEIILFRKENLIEQMNGVDPLTIQNKVFSEFGEFITLDEIIQKL